MASCKIYLTRNKKLDLHTANELDLLHFKIGFMLRFSRSDIFFSSSGSETYTAPELKRGGFKDSHLYHVLKVSVIKTTRLLYFCD